MRDFLSGRSEAPGGASSHVPSTVVSRLYWKPKPLTTVLPDQILASNYRTALIRCMLTLDMRGRILRLFCSVWFIAAIALALRVGFLLHQARGIPPGVLAQVPFENEVGNVAAALHEGRGFCCLFRQPTGPTAWLSPVYPMIVAVIFKLAGTYSLLSFYLVVLFNCVCSALACLPLFFAGQRIGFRATAAGAAWLWALFPTGIVLPFEWVWDTSLAALLAAALLWATLALAESSRLRDYAAYGLLWGFSLLTNPSLGAALPVFFLWIIYRRLHLGDRRLQPLLLSLAVIGAVCLPWTIRNYVQFHRFIPLRANFPYELWSGNNEIFDPHSRAPSRITRYEEVHRYATLGENAFLAEKWRNACMFIRTRPGLFARLCGRRIVATWLGTDSPWADFWRSDSWFVRYLFLWNVVVLLSAFLGVARLFCARSDSLVPLLAFPVLFPLTFYLAHSTLRHRHPADPILALLMAVALFGARTHSPLKWE